MAGVKNKGEKEEKKNENCFMSFILSQQISCKAPESTSAKPPTRIIIIIILYWSFPFISTLFSLSLLLLLPYYHNIYLCLYKNIPFHFSIHICVCVHSFVCTHDSHLSYLGRDRGKKIIIHKKIMRCCAGLTKIKGIFKNMH